MQMCKAYRQRLREIRIQTNAVVGDLPGRIGLSSAGAGMLGGGANLHYLRNLD